MDNPTPANWSLVDPEGEWILSTQGDGAQLLDDLPGWKHDRAHWVATQFNGYGFGCGCMMMTSTPKDGLHIVTAITNVRIKPIASCRSDKKLPQKKWQRVPEIEEMGNDIYH